MARNTAIICEFNPLHNGHKAILSHAAEKGDTVIAIMSGNFTQRSECAVFDKYKRARLAVAMGADAVFELPFPWCSAGGEFFALGGVGVAAGLTLDSFIFGSETGNTDYVKRAAEILSTDEALTAIAGGEKGDGVAVSADKFLETYGISLSSNDKLATEYMKAANKLNLSANFSAYKRMTVENLYKSATDIRKMIYSGEDFSSVVPEETLKLCGKVSDIREGALEEVIFNFFRICPSAPDNIFEASGGVSERLMKAAASAVSAGELFPLAATKKYTNSRLRRAALFTLLGVEKRDLTSPPPFTVLLAANEKGCKFLSEIKKTKKIEVLTKPSAYNLTNESEKRSYELWRRADELYSLCLRQGVKAGEYLRRSPNIL